MKYSNEQTTPARDLPGYVDLNELMKSPPTSEPWIVPGIIAEQRLTALVGEAKIGKSLLALELAAAIATGRSVLGHPTIKTKTLYIDMENNVESDIKTRLHSMGYRPGDLDNLIYLSFPTLAALDTKRGGERLKSIIDEHQIGLGFLDTVGRLVDGEENSNDTWNRYYKYTELLLKQSRVAVVRLDHTGKDGSKGARGGSAKSGDVDLVIRMTVNRDGIITLRRDAGRMSDGFEVLQLERMDEPYLRHAVVKGGIRRDTEAKISGLCQLLDDHGVARGISNNETREALKRLNKTCSKDISAEVTRRRKATAEVLDPCPDPQSRPDGAPGSVHSWHIPTPTGMSRPRRLVRRDCRWEQGFSVPRG